MIVHEFDKGWGSQWFLKKLEQELLRKYLKPLHESKKRVAVINSVWYDQNYHAHVKSVLRTDPVDVVVLVSMLDTAILRSDWFNEFDIPVLEVGYYKGPYELDFWAIMVHRYLDWSFQKHSDHRDQIKYCFMCLNRKPHPHRVRLYQDLSEHGLLDKGLVSLGGDSQRPPTKILTSSIAVDNLAPNSGSDEHGINNDIASLGNQDLWCSHFLNIVTETTWNISDTWFVTEKLYKPIMGKRPFLLYDPDGGEAWFAEHGLKSYTDSFKDISDLDLRDPKNIAPFLVTLHNQGEAYWKAKYIDLDEHMRYNRISFRDHYLKQYQKINQGIQCQI